VARETALRDTGDASVAMKAGAMTVSATFIALEESLAHSDVSLADSCLRALFCDSRERYLAQDPLTPPAQSKLAEPRHSQKLEKVCAALVTQTAEPRPR